MCEGSLVVPSSDAAKVCAFIAWLAVMLERVGRGDPPIPGIDRPGLDTAAHNRIERACRDTVRRFGFEPSRSDSWMPPPANVVDRLLLELLSSVRGEPWESILWANVLRLLPTLLPTEFVDDLIARDIENTQLAHMPLSDRDLWKLVDVDEALLKLACRRYTSASYSADAFEEVLYAKPGHVWMLETLKRCDASDEAKERLFDAAVATIKRDRPPKEPADD